MTWFARNKKKKKKERIHTPFPYFGTELVEVPDLASKNK
jgi:hypothetical protein